MSKSYKKEFVITYFLFTFFVLLFIRIGFLYKDIKYERDNYYRIISFNNINISKMNINGYYMHGDYYIVWVKDRTPEEIKTTEYHEACHYFIDIDWNHFCNESKQTIWSDNNYFKDYNLEWKYTTKQ